MDLYQSKTSSFNRTDLTASERQSRGYHPEISTITQRVRPLRTHISGRRYFTFKGNQNRQGNQSKGRQSTFSSFRRTPASVARPAPPSETKSPLSKTSYTVEAFTTPYSYGLHQRAKSHSTLRSRSAQIPSSRLGKSKASSVSSAATSTHSSISRASKTTDNVEISTRTSNGTIDDLIIRDVTPELSKSLPTSAGKENIISPANNGNDDSSGDITNKSVVSEKIKVDQQHEVSSIKETEVKIILPSPVSPPVVGFKKFIYDDREDKWIEHVKIVESEEHFNERMKQQKLNNIQRSPIPLHAHKVKGRQTARIQAMFPTALIRNSRKPLEHSNFNLTDSLRLELHKRRVPVVPIYFQKHILKYGKLPFRNNPRSHART